MKKFILVFVASTCSLFVVAQNIYRSSKSEVSFFAGTAIEDIDGKSSEAVSAIDLIDGSVAVSIPIKTFHFEQSLMEEHFNENYMETEKFPKATFKGKIENLGSITWTSTTPFVAKVSGVLTMHGVSLPRTFEVTFQNKDGKLQASASFPVKLEEFNIDRPKILWEKLAEEVKVQLNISYEEYKGVVRR